MDLLCEIRESSFNMTGGVMKILRGGGLENFTHPKGGLWKNCWARRGGDSENLLTSKQTHDIIIQIGWFPTQQFNVDLCDSAT